VLRSDWLTQGPAVEQFEKVVCQYCSAGFGVAANSATSALHIGCLALDLGPGDVLWTVPNTFVASANAALYCGARVDFVDIDERSYNMSVVALAEKLEKAKKTGNLPKVVMPVHFSGQSCDMREIAGLAQKYGFSIIEDASHAIGGRYREKTVGSCEYSSIAVFSFHPVKIVTTGEGGMAVTNDPKLAARMRLLRAHGITRDVALMKNSSAGPWYYEQIDLGFNYRMTDMQAALGSSQMQRIDNFVRRRHTLVDRYDAGLKDQPVILPWKYPEAYSAHHLYVVRIDESKTARTRKEVFLQLRSNGIGVNVHYIPVHTQPFYAAAGFRKGDFPVAEKYYAGALTLPLFNGLAEDQQDAVMERVHEAFS
jgi:UDP-4-amino-4,6-dideoxy-N-acetyl-beta-L-altrosamine transaminase